MASEVAINEVTEKVKEYAELSKTIKITQEKLKVLNKRKTILYKEVVPKLKTSNITKCNLPFATLKVVNTKKKVTPNKASMKDKYISFFNTRAMDEDFCLATAEERAEIMFKYIYLENIEYTNAQSITMTYNKEFKEELKEMVSG
jgi:hypothetical protein